MTELPRIPLAGVIGHPIAQSRSPQLHGHWLARYGIKGHYVPMDVAPDDLPQALAMLPKLGFVGVNVTIPHKEAALKLAHEVTDRAALIGAANTLIFLKDGKIYADPIQFPDRMGVQIVDAILRHSKGEAIPPQILIPTSLYRKADAEKDPSLK